MNASLATAARPSEQNFDRLFEKLSAFIHKHHKNPGKTDDPVLWAWMRELRTKYKRKILDHNSIELLNAIGFKWTSKEAKWFSKAEEIKQYIKQHRKTPSFSECPALHYWLRDSHDRLRNKTLPGDKRMVMEDIYTLIKTIS